MNFDTVRLTVPRKMEEQRRAVRCPRPPLGKALQGLDLINIAFPNQNFVVVLFCHVAGGRQGCI